MQTPVEAPAGSQYQLTNDDLELGMYDIAKTLKNKGYGVRLSAPHIAFYPQIKGWDDGMLEYKIEWFDPHQPKPDIRVALVSIPGFANALVFFKGMPGLGVSRLLKP